VDCHTSADAAALLLVAWGRQSQSEAIARGKLLAWGRKPWLGVEVPRPHAKPLSVGPTSEEAMCDDVGRTALGGQGGDSGARDRRNERRLNAWARPWREPRPALAARARD
jgi:hypothetical protein